MNIGHNAKNYRPDIDGLRALAVLAVLGFHFFPGKIASGFVGVDIFFVISGFLISGIVLDDLEENRFSFSGFYARRIRRLFPALFFVLAFGLFIGWNILFPDEFKALGKHIFGGAGFISNILYWRESGYFDTEAAAKPLLHLWSLGIEEQFYIFFPFFLFFLYKKGAREIFFIAVFLAASLLYSFNLAEKNQVSAFYSPLSRFWELFLGAVLAWQGRLPQDSTPRLMASDCGLFISKIISKIIYKNPGAAQAEAALGNFLSALGFLMLAYSVFAFAGAPDWPGRRAIIPGAGAAALIIGAGAKSYLNRKILSNPLAVAIGLISYPLYLWHWPILSFLRVLSGGIPARPHKIAAILISLALAWITYKFVERPFRFGKKYRAAKAWLLLAIMGLAAGSGLYIYFNGGLPDRSVVVTHKAILEGAETVDRDFSYRDVGSPIAVAVIGDSHAQHAYSGIVSQNSELGLNTMFLNYPLRHTDLSVPLNIDLEQRLDTLNQLKAREDVAAVFILNRGVLDLTGSDIDDGYGGNPYVAALYEQYKPHLQKTIDKLNAFGKKVYVVSENPVLPYVPKKYLTRPFSSYFLAKKPLPPTREEVLRHQAGYLEILKEIKGATIIYSTDAFCPLTEERCLDFLPDGQVLYSDDDHLSKSGSRFQAEKLLAPYLKEIASANQQQ